MKKEEIEEKISDAEKKRKAFEQSRSFCTIVAFFIIYYLIQGAREDSPSFIFYILMSLMACIAVGLFAFVSVKIRGFNRTKKELAAELEKIQENESTEDELPEEKPFENEESKTEE